MKTSGSELSIIVETLTRKKMINLVDGIVAIDREYIRELGSRFCTFPWGRDNYLLDLKGKWELSQVALLLDKGVAGVWVASNIVKDVCHTHRVLVANQCRRAGVAISMFEQVEIKTREIGLTKMTIEVSCLNNVALAFYKKLGFSLMKSSEILEYLECRGRKAKVLQDCIEEEDGSQYHVCKRQII